MATVSTRWANSEEDYRRLGLKKDTILEKEDGMRTPGDDRTYEWWYADFVLESGAKLCVTFTIKRCICAIWPVDPHIMCVLDLPDGTHLNLAERFSPEDFHASTETADVVMGKNTFKGDLHHFDIHLDMKGVKADLHIENAGPSWRPESGIIYMGDHDEHCLGWLPAVPNGKSSGTIELEDGTVIPVDGSSYHDHNWGTSTMTEDFYRWYWGRAKIGAYNVLTNITYTEKQYGYKPFIELMIMKDGQIVADSNQHEVVETEDDRCIDTETGKPYHKKIMFDYNDGTNRYVVIYRAKDLLFRQNNLVALPPEKREEYVNSGFNSYYMRFYGTITLEHYVNGELVDTAEDTEGLWEQMHMCGVGRENEL